MAALEKARVRGKPAGAAFETISVPSADLAGRIASDRTPAKSETIEYSRALVSDGKAFGNYIVRKRTGRTGGGK